MKAIVYKKYGPPNVAELTDVVKPIPKENEVLVRVYASTVNRTDAGLRSAQYFISRFFTGLMRPKNQILGCEFAGCIEQIGDKVTLFKIGDRVFGFKDNGAGGHAEFLTIKETDAIGTIPKELSYLEGAPITEGAHYALNNIRAATVKEGQNVLVNGATGAIGSAAVQLLKYYGATVTAVCNSKNKELVKSLGADFIIGYETSDFTKTDKKFDFIFDAVGKSSFQKCKPLLCKKGVYISTELGKYSANIFLALITPIFKKKKVLFPLPVMNKEIIQLLSNLVEHGKFIPLIDRVYKMPQIVEAYTYVESKQKLGNVVLKIAENTNKNDLGLIAT
ncbi:NAD(P)-dependent alcohol dehydrogenase [Pedobacter kyonggii]|uniref:NAD(P)-dependent alcohol dehydrogenase n=1 Tax=Pedobacter kyonggii TaxID=1926871 RepID=A0A4V2JH39_9SPHI|nr:NAD(P)-dependent alcohol dehydrogenase [Pedobacter kyonggii]TBO43619.1 NAD(P)-dependent alcohol dehydrogenase [Pedobacter kyonggii]